MARRYSSNTSGNALTVALIVIVVAVLALGVWAVWEPIAKNVRSNQLANGAEYTVEELADQSGMEVDEFLAQYGVADQGLKGSSLMSEMTAPMTLTNYASFMGVSLTDEDFAEFKAEQGLGDDVTMDTTDSEIKTQYVMYEYQKEQAAQATAAPEGGETVDAAGATTTDEAAADTTGTADSATEETANNGADAVSDAE